MAEMNANAAVTIRPVTDKAGLNAFIDVGYRLTRDDPNQVLPLRMDMVEMFNPAKNPFFGHARVQPMVAYRGGRVVGRISAHIDELALTQPVEQGMGPGTGSWAFWRRRMRALPPH